MGKTLYGFFFYDIGDIGVNLHSFALHEVCFSTRYHFQGPFSSLFTNKRQVVTSCKGCVIGLVKLISNGKKTSRVKSRCQ